MAQFQRTKKVGGWLAKALAKLTQFVQAPDKTLSATRLVFIVYAATLIAVWAYTSVNNSTVADIPNSVAIIFLSLMAGKAVQSLGEKKQ